MDPSHRGSYRFASNRDYDEVHIVINFFDQTPPNCNNTVYRSDASGVPATRRPEIDLNNLEQQEEDSPVYAPVVDAPVQQAPVLDYTGSNYENSIYGSSNYGSSSGGVSFDWARGSINVAPDEKLEFYENADPPTEPMRSHGDTGFDLNAAVLEAQERDEAYC